MSQLSLGLCLFIMRVCIEPDITFPSSERVPFAVAQRDGLPVIGAECSIATYQQNALGIIIKPLGLEWKDSFRSTPELVSAFSRYFSIKQEWEAQSSLCYRDRDKQAILKSVRRESPYDVTRELTELQLQQRMSVHDYEYVFWTNRSPSRESLDSIPDILLRRDNGYYRTFEIDLMSAANWISTLTPLYDLRRESLPKPREYFRALTLFELIPIYSRSDDGSTKWELVHLEWGEIEGIAETGAGRVFVFVSIVAGDGQRGFGRSVAELSESGRKGDDTQTPQALLSVALAKVFSATTLEEQKAAHLRRYHYYLDRREERREKQAISKTRRPDAYQGLGGLARGSALRRESRLIATVDGGVGHVHFFWNPPDALKPEGWVVPVVVQIEDGAPKLGDSFNGHDGAVSELVSTEEFRAGLLEYLKEAHPEVLRAAGVPLTELGS